MQPFHIELIIGEMDPELEEVSEVLEPIEE